MTRLPSSSSSLSSFFHLIVIGEVVTHLEFFDHPFVGCLIQTKPEVTVRPVSVEKGNLLSLGQSQWHPLVGKVPPKKESV